MTREGEDRIKHLDLFSGIGGFALAADRVFGNVEHTFCEIDPFCQEVLKKHWPEAEIYGDIRTLTADAECERSERRGGNRDVVSSSGKDEGASKERQRNGDAAHDSGATVAHPLGAGLEVRPRLAGHLAEELAALERGRQAVADAEGEQAGGVQQSGVSPDASANGDGRGQAAAREPESRLGRGFDGPAAWLDGTWERGIQRVAQGVPNRVQRLRALGNAVVPAVVEIIGRAIMASERLTGADGE